MTKFMFVFVFSLVLANLSQAHVLEILENHLIKFNLSSVQNVNADDRVVIWNFGNIIFPYNKSVEFGITFYSPTKPGNYPIIAFFSGLDGFAPNFAYNNFNTKVSIATNSIIVGFDSLKFPKLPDKEQEIFGKTLNWTLENIQALFNNDKTPKNIRGQVFPDLEQKGVTLMAHSASGHSVVSYLVNSCGLIEKLILLDPVDGYDPFGFIKIFITNPPAQLAFTTPTLVIQTGFDNTPVAHGFPPCAPVNVSNVRFYDSLPGPTWFLNFTEYGHVDILDDWVREYGGRFICYGCKINCDFEVYRINVVKAIEIFYKGVDQKNLTLINSLENAAQSGLFSLNVTSMYKHNGYDVMSTGPFCIRTVKSKHFRLFQKNF